MADPSREEREPPPSNAPEDFNGRAGRPGSNLQQNWADLEKVVPQVVGIVLDVPESWRCIARDLVGPAVTHLPGTRLFRYGPPRPRRPTMTTTTTAPDRAEINRRNAARSTGPRTAEGKSRSRFNA